MLEVIVLCVCPLLFVVGATTDVVSFRIPNWVSLALIVSFFFAALIAGQPLGVIAGHLIAGIVALAATIGLFAVGAFGGGDVKLFSAGALWAGPAALTEYAFWMAMAGGVLAITLLVMRRTPLSAFASSIPALRPLMMAKAGMPYGVAIAAGAFIALPKTPLFQMVLA